MNPLPLSLRTPAARAFMAGELTRLRRPRGGIYRNAVAGGLLWIREPYRLARKFGGLSPTAAERLGARPHFSTELTQRIVEQLELGAEWPARNLLKVWHRQHARILSVECQRLQEITEHEARAEGFSSRAAWARSWVREIKLSRRAHEWHENPEVLVLTLARIPAAIDFSSLGEAA